MQFQNGWKNPSHSQVPGIVDQLSGVPKATIKLALKRLRLSRVASDYGVGLTVTMPEARERLRDCAFIFREISGR
jgi:hypothetical protein